MKPFGSLDARGKRIPLLAEVADFLDLQKYFPKDLRLISISDFESAFSLLHSRDPQSCIPIEHQIHEYFSAMLLPDELTIYDQLLLGLRRKDAIFTFNWDPLIVQSYSRIAESVGREHLPSIYFLHGNAAINNCPTCVPNCGIGKRKCPVCRVPMIQTQLVYPVGKKNYQSNFFIASQWEALAAYVKSASIFTIYGYSAPVSDVEAIEIFKEAWGEQVGTDWKDETVRRFEQIEIICRTGADHELLRDNWSSFIHTHHYDIYEDFASSWIGQFPRRTVEAYIRQILRAEWIEAIEKLGFSNFTDAINWHGKLIAEEI